MSDLLVEPKPLCVDSCSTFFSVVEVEFKERYYSRVEDQGSVEVCAHLTGRAEREVSATFSTRDSEEGPLGKSKSFIPYLICCNCTIIACL